MILYKVTRYNRHNVTDERYYVDGGLTKQEVLDLYSFLIDPEDFDDAVESGYIGKNSMHEYEIDEEFIM